VSDIHIQGAIAQCMSLAKFRASCQAKTFRLAPIQYSSRLSRATARHLKFALLGRHLPCIAIMPKIQGMKTTRGGAMHKRRHLPWAIALTVLTIFALSAMPGSRASAQTITGSIYGTVTDPTGAVLPGAAITVTNIGTNEVHTTKSNGTGAYVFSLLNPGEYKVSSSDPGFKTVIQSDVRLAANQNVNVSFVMTPGATHTSVTVQADTTLVDTRESTVSTTIDQRRIEDLPLVGRSAYDLIKLVPGIVNYHASAQIGDVSGTQFSTNGLPGDYNTFYLDGSFDTEFYRGGGGIVPNPDALAEFSILTSNQDAAFGRNPGAVVNTITRSGSNQYHGVAYDFLRNADLNAKNYFANSVTPLVYNVFGAGFGGPAIRNKFFYFLSYQGTRIHTPAFVTSASLIVPSALERQGNFSQSAKQPSTNGCAPGQTPVAPATICMDPVAVALLVYVPLPAHSANHPAQQTAPANTRADQGVARLDYQLNAAHKLQLTFFQSRGNSLTPNAGGNNIFTYGGGSDVGDQSNYIVGDTWIISPRLVNSFRGTYMLNKFIQVPSAGGRLADLGSAIPEGDKLGLSTQPGMNVSGYFHLAGAGTANQAQLMYGVSDTLNYSKGRHTAKFGGELMESRYQETTVWNGSTINTFTGSSTGNALADFEEGHINAFTQNSGVYHRTHALDPSLYAQDDWQVTRRLTLDIGMRWEVFYPLHGQRDTGTFVPGVQSKRFPTAPVGLLFPGDPGVPDGVLHASYKRFAPRVGFATDVFGNGRLALKGSYGIFYSVNRETLSGNLVQEPFELQIGLSKTKSLVNPYSGITPYNGVSPFAAFNPTGNPSFVAGAGLDGLRPYTSATPYVQEYNLSVQEQLGANWSMQIGYVGNVARKFIHPRDENAPIYAPGASASNASIQSRRPYQPEGAIAEYDSSNNMNYNSLQVSLTKQFAHGFSLLASYVWSKSMDIADVSPTAGAAFTLADENNQAMDYGMSIDNLPQRFVASYLYALPAVRRYGIFGEKVLSGWQINGITTIESGNPFNIISNRDTNFDGILTDRPEVIGNPLLGSGRSRSQKIAEFFNTAAYALPGTGNLYGNSRRNSLLSPGYVDTDLSAFKRFAVYGESDLLFRGEIFNTFNNVNLNAPNGTLGNPNFGKITSAGAPRIVQLALKFEF